MLAQGTEPLAERLGTAYRFTLPLLQPDQVGETTWAGLELLRARLTRMPASDDEGTVLATTRLMSEDEASKIIDIIVDLYGQVAHEAGRM